MAAGTPDEKFQKLREENERRRKKKEEEEKRRKQEEDQKAKEALERRRQERLEQDERMRKPWQQPPSPKKPILRKGAKQKPMQPASPAVDPVRQSQAEEKRREWRQGLQDFIKQQRQQAAAAAKTPAAGPPLGADGVPAVPLTWEELRMAAEAGFDELLRQQELEAEQRAAVEPTARAARHRSPFKSPFRGAPAPPQETVQVALVPTQQHSCGSSGATASATAAGSTRGSPARPSAPRQAPPDHSGGPTAVAGVCQQGQPGSCGKYSDAQGRDGSAASGPAALTTSAWPSPPPPAPQPQSQMQTQYQQQQQHVSPGSDGGGLACARGSPKWCSQQLSADAATGDSSVNGLSEAALDPPSPSTMANGQPERSSWADGYAGFTGDGHAGSGTGASESVASSGGVRRGVTSTARHRAAPMDPALLDFAAQPAPFGAVTDPWVSEALPLPQPSLAEGGFGNQADGVSAGSQPLSSPRSPTSQRPRRPGPYDAFSQQEWPPAVVAGSYSPVDPTPQQDPPQVPAAVGPGLRLGPLDDSLEASLQEGGTLAALEQADESRLSSARPAGQLLPPATAPAPLPPPQQQQNQGAPDLALASASQSQDYHPGAQQAQGVAAELPLPPAQQCARQDQRHARRGWGVPTQLPAETSASPPPPPLAGPSATSAADSGVPLDLPTDPHLPPGAHSSADAEDASAPVAPLFGVAALRPSPQEDGQAVWPEAPQPSQRAARSPHKDGAGMCKKEEGNPDGEGAAGRRVDQAPAAVGLASRLRNLPQTFSGAAAPGTAALGTTADRVDMSADLVRFSSPPGPSLASSHGSSPSASPAHPVNHSPSELQQAAGGEPPPQQQQLVRAPPPQPPQRQPMPPLLQQRRISRVSFDQAGSAAVAAQAEEEEKEQDPVPLATPSTTMNCSVNDPRFSQAQIAAEQRPYGPQPENGSGLPVGSVATSQAQPQQPQPQQPPDYIRILGSVSNAPEQSLPSGLRRSLSQSQPQAPLLPPIVPPRPLSGSVALSNAGYQVAAPLSLPPLSPPATAGDNDNAAAATSVTQLQQTPQPQQQPQGPQQQPTFRAPSPPPSPPRSGGASQRFNRQHSTTSLLVNVGSSSGGGGSASTLPLSSVGQGQGPATAEVASGGGIALPGAGHQAANASAPAPPPPKKQQLARQRQQQQEVLQPQPTGSSPRGRPLPQQRSPAAFSAASPQQSLQEPQQQRQRQPDRLQPGTPQRQQQQEQLQQQQPTESAKCHSLAVAQLGAAAAVTVAASPHEPGLPATTASAASRPSPTATINPGPAAAEQPPLQQQLPSTVAPVSCSGVASSGTPGHLQPALPAPSSTGILAPTTRTSSSGLRDAAVVMARVAGNREPPLNRSREVTAACRSSFKGPQVLAEGEEPSKAGVRWVVEDGPSNAVNAAESSGAAHGGTEDTGAGVEVEVARAELDGELEVEAEEALEVGDASDGVGGRNPPAMMEDSLERPPGSAEGSVLTGSHISTRPWSGPSTGPGGGGSRLGGSGYQIYLLDDSVSSFDFRARSAAASRPASALSSSAALCTPLPAPALSSQLYPAATTAGPVATPSWPAAAGAGDGAGKPLLNGPSASVVGMGQAATSGALQAPQPAGVLHVARAPEPAAGDDLGGVEGLGLAATRGRPPASNLASRVAAPNADVAAAHDTFSEVVLQWPAGGRASGGCGCNVDGDDGDTDGQPFFEGKLDEPDGRYGGAGTDPAAADWGSSTAAVTAAPVAAAAAAALDPDLDALIREVQELSALRKALKAEFEIMGHGEAVAGLGTLSANFVVSPPPPPPPPPPPRLTAEAGSVDAEAELPLSLPPSLQQPPQLKPQPIAAAPLLQWDVPGKPLAQASSMTKAIHSPGQVATASPAAAVAHVPDAQQVTQPHARQQQPLLPHPAAAVYAHDDGLPQPQQQLQQQLQQRELAAAAAARWQLAPQLPTSVAIPAAPPSSSGTSSEPSPPLQPRPADTLAAGFGTFSAQPAAFVMPVGLGQGLGHGPAHDYSGGWGHAAPMHAAAASAASAAVPMGVISGATESSHGGSFAFASPASLAPDRVGIMAGSGGLDPPAPLLTMALAQPAPTQPATAPLAMQWTIPVSGFVGGAAGAAPAAAAAITTSTSTSGSATAPSRKTAPPQPKRSPSGDDYTPPAAATAAADSSGSGSGPGAKRRGGSAPAQAAVNATALIGRQTATPAVAAAGAPVERPLVNDGSYALAAVQARQRAERERAAREALQAESAAAKAAIVKRSKSERAAVAAGSPGPAAVAAASSGGSTKDTSPLGPKAPSTIGSYVRQPSPARVAATAPATAVAAVRSATGGDNGGDGACISSPTSEALEMAPTAGVAKQAWGVPSNTPWQHSRIPPPPRAPCAGAPTTTPAATATHFPVVATPPSPSREDSLGSDFDFLERASDISDSETDSPEAYGVSSKATPPPPPRREAFASPPPPAAAASEAYRERLAEARPQPLRIPSSAAATPMGGASAASTVASRAAPTGGRGHGGGGGAATAAGQGGGRPGGRGPSTPFTAAIRELMGLPGSAPLEQSRAAAGKQQQQQRRGQAPALAGQGQGRGQSKGAQDVEPIRLLSEEEDKLLASLKRLDAAILRRGLMAAGIIDDPQLQPAGTQQGGDATTAAGPAAATTAAPTAAKGSRAVPRGPAKGSGGSGGGATTTAAAAGAYPSPPLTNSVQQAQLRESLERLDVRLGALQRKIDERGCSLGNPPDAATGGGSGGGGGAQRQGATQPRDERRAPPATLAKSRTPTPNKAKAIRDQRQQQLSAVQGPTPSPARTLASSAAAHPPKPASAPTVSTMAAAAAATSTAEPPPLLHMQHQLLQPAAAAGGGASGAAAAAPGAQPFGMPPRAPAAKAPSSAPSGPAAVNAALQQQEQYQQRLSAAAAAAAAGGMPFGAMPGGGVAFDPGAGGISSMMPVFTPPSPQQLLQGPLPVGVAQKQQRVAYVPAMLPNGQMAFVPQYVQPSGAAGAFQGFLHGAPAAGGFGQAGPMQQQQPVMLPPLMMMMPQPGAAFPGMPMQHQEHQQQQLGGAGPMLAWGAGPIQAAPSQPSQPQQQLQQYGSVPQSPQSLQQQNVSYSSGSGGGDGGVGPRLYSFDRSGPAGHGTGYRRSSQDGAAAGYSQARQAQQQPSSTLPYATGPPPSGPMPQYHSTVMRSRSIGSRDGEAVAAVAAAAGLTNLPHHLQYPHTVQHHHQQSNHEDHQNEQQQQQHQVQGLQGKAHAFPSQQHQQAPYGDQPGGGREHHNHQHQRHGQGQVQVQAQGQSVSSHPHPVQVQSFGPNGSSRGLGQAGGWGMAGPGGSGGGDDAGVIKAVNLGLLMS